MTTLADVLAESELTAISAVRDSLLRGPLRAVFADLTSAPPDEAPEPQQRAVYRCKAIILGSGSRVTSLAISDCRLVSGHANGTLIQWEINLEDTSIRRLTHQDLADGAVTALAVSPTLLLAGTARKTVLTLAAGSRAPRRLAGRHTRGIVGVVGGDVPISLGGEGVVAGWAGAGWALRGGGGGRVLGTALAGLGAGLGVAGYADGSVCVLGYSAGKAGWLDRAALHSKSVRSIITNGNINNTNEFYSVSHDEVIEWRFNTESSSLERLTRSPLPPSPTGTLVAATGLASGELALGYTDGTVLVLNPRTGEERGREQAQGQGGSGGVMALVGVCAGVFITGHEDSSIRLWILE